MNTLFTYTKKTVPARFLALVTMFAMLLSAFPVAFSVAEAATPTVLFSDGFETGDFSEWGY